MAYEKRVKQLVSEGISPTDARRNALQEIKTFSEEPRRDARLNQANTRILLSFLKWLFK